MHMYMNGYKYIMETYELDHIYTIFSTIKKHENTVKRNIHMLTSWKKKSLNFSFKSQF